MELSIKNILLSNSFILLCSITIGYSLWLMLSQNQIIAQTITTPAVVYHKQTVINQTPIIIHVEGSRTQLRTLNYQPPQITFYREEHPENLINITPHDILLPETVNLVDYAPKSISLA